MELSTYFRINAMNTGQFERTLVIADEDSYVSYLEGCTAPQRDENQLHAAVVELVALKARRDQIQHRAELVPRRQEGKGGIYNFVTKRGICAGALQQDFVDAGGDGFGHHVEISELHPQGRQQHRGILLRGRDQQLPAGRHGHQDDPSGQEHPQHHHLEGYFGRKEQQQLPRTGAHDAAMPTNARNFSQCDSLLLGDRCGAHTFPYIETQNSTAKVEHEATTQSRRGPDLLLQPARTGHRAGHRPHRERLLQGSIEQTPDGVRRGGAEAAGCLSLEGSV
jgi:Fe-S cluster assembly protein SufB